MCNSDLDSKMNWKLIGKATGINNIVTISASIIGIANDIQVFVKTQISNGVTGTIYATSILKTTDIIMGGYYYDSKYYASIGIQTKSNSDKTLDVCLLGSWSRVVSNGTALSLSNAIIEVWYK